MPRLTGLVVHHLLWNTMNRRTVLDSASCCTRTFLQYRMPCLYHARWQFAGIVLPINAAACLTILTSQRCFAGTIIVDSCRRSFCIGKSGPKAAPLQLVVAWQVSQSGILQRSQPEKSPSLQFIKLQSDEMQPRFRCKILGGVERGHGPDRRKHQGRSTGETPGLLWKCGFSKLSKENIETRRSLNERLQQNKVAGTFFSPQVASSVSIKSQMKHHSCEAKSCRSSSPSVF